jgi:hypothetical protein
LVINQRVQLILQTALATVALMGFLSLGAPVRGDAGIPLPQIGPRPGAEIRVTIEGRLLPPGAFEALILTHREAKPGSQGSKVKSWVHDPYWFGGQGKDGWVWFEALERDSQGARRQDGSRVKIAAPSNPPWLDRLLTGENTSRPADVKYWDRRLALYLPWENKGYLTRPFAIDPGRLNYLNADLLPDGNATIRGVLPPVWKYFGVGPLIALACTLAVELIVVFVWIWAIRRRRPDRRIVLAWLVGNLISHPLIWYAAISARSYLEPSSGLTAYRIPFFLALQLGAAIFEGVLYQRVGGLNARNAFGMSLVANTASVVFGCCLVGLIS